MPQAPETTSAASPRSHFAGEIAQPGGGLTRRKLAQGAAGVCASLGFPLLQTAQAQPALALPGITPTEIRIGQTAATTGPLSAANLQVIAATKAVFESVNAKGGINKRKLVLVTLDDAYDPARAVENVRKLATTDNGVFTFFGIGGAPANMAVAPFLQEIKVPHVAPMTGTDALRTPDNTMAFHIRAAYSAELAKIANYMATTGFNEIAVLHSDNAFGKGSLAGFQQLAAKEGVKIVGTVVMPDKLDNPASITEALVKSNAKAVLGVVAANSALGWAKTELPKLGRPYLTLSLLGNEGTVRLLGESAKGLIVTQTVPYPYSRKYPIANEYVSLMKDAPEGSLGFTGMEGFIGAKVLVEALTRAGPNPTREGFISAMTAKKFDLNGYTVDFSGNKRVGSLFVELSFIQSGGKFIQ